MVVMEVPLGTPSRNPLFNLLLTCLFFFFFSSVLFCPFSFCFLQSKELIIYIYQFICIYT